MLLYFGDSKIQRMAMQPAHFLAVFCFAVVNAVSCGVIELRNEPTCLPGDDYFSAGPECYNFYSCRNGVVEIIECPGGLLWNDDIKRCDVAENVQCEAEQTPEPTTQAPTTEAPTPAPTTEAPTPAPTTSTPSNTFLPEVEGALPILFPGSECPEDIRAFLLHPTDCRRYYFCLYGVQYPQTCPFLESFNFVVGRCVPQDQSFCFPGSE
ncbi:peritrophin-1-like isoform X1 [Anopheles merus]|uniref:peritrophin-1-like isoform X1 n=1 Tax=Anopheles merus TaxID=30066 RepID=UPI001BE3DE4D|nr:peritrophin-1-like isoform X1 [Anopheles merus]